MIENMNNSIIFSREMNENGNNASNSEFKDIEYVDYPEYLTSDHEPELNESISQQMKEEPTSEYDEPECFSRERVSLGCELPSKVTRKKSKFSRGKKSVTEKKDKKLGRFIIGFH
jgi:hypothetical protein